MDENSLLERRFLKQFTKAKYLKLELSMRSGFGSNSGIHISLPNEIGMAKDTFSGWRDDHGVYRGVVRRGVIGTAV